MESSLHAALTKALYFLFNDQQPDGSFLSYSSTNQLDFNQAIARPAIFQNAFILSALAEVQCENAINQTAVSIRKRLANFLLAQKSKYWTFNYWSRQAAEQHTLPYPDDLDDTCCVLAALHQHDAHLLTGEALAKLVQLFTSVEQRAGGPYYTWFTQNPDAAWQDVDVVVNSNVAYFLSRLDVALPNITALVDEAIISRGLQSRYYPSEFAALYCIVRAYDGAQSNQLAQHLDNLVKRSDQSMTSLDIAFALLTAMCLPAESVKWNDWQSSVDRLLQQQQTNGSWPASGWVAEQQAYAGSAAFTTAMCLQAVAQYHARQTRVERTPHTNKNDQLSLELQQTILQRALNRFQIVTPVVAHLAKESLITLLNQKQAQQITLLPYYFAQALSASRCKVPKELLIQLGLANLYGWLAYTIYDDFLDGEAELPLLSIANICLREVTLVYQTILPDTALPQLAQELLDQIDAVNCWEVSTCRIATPIITKDLVLPDYGNYAVLAQRSLGHALGPLAILLSLGYAETSEEVKAVQQFFYHYLIARQLNDDAHDWAQDLQRGQVNSVGNKILQQWQQETYPLFNGDIINHQKQWQSIFWHSTILQVCDDIKQHSQRATSALQSVQVIERPELLQQFLTPLTAAAQQALRERQQTLDFLDSYRA